MVLYLAFGLFLAIVNAQPAARGAPCAPLAIPYAVYEPPIAGYNSIADGGRVKVDCNPGYENQGASWVICQKGRWITAVWEGTSAAPQCLAGCSAPNITNAVFTPAISAKSMTRHGTRVTVSCADGFDFIGSSTISCYYGQWTGLNDGRCFSTNESFCRDDSMVPVISGILADSAGDAYKASQEINYYFLQMQGIQAEGLEYLGINPSAPQKSYDKLAYYIPGMTGSDAVFRAVVIPAHWNVTALPAHLSAQSAYCRVSSHDNSLTAYVLKVLYRQNWGQFSFQ